MWNIFFVDTTDFCGTQYFFVLPSVSIKNIVYKEKQMYSYEVKICENLKKQMWKSESAMLFSTLWLGFLALEKSNGNKI